MMMTAITKIVVVALEMTTIGEAEAGALLPKRIVAVLATVVLMVVEIVAVRVVVVAEATVAVAAGLVEVVVARLVVKTAMEVVAAASVTTAEGDSNLVEEVSGIMEEMNDGATARGVMVVAMEVVMRGVAKAMEHVIGIVTTSSSSSLSRSAATLQRVRVNG